MVTNLNYYFTDCEEFRKEIRALIEDQYEHDLYKKSFSNQFETDDVVDDLQQKIEWWMVVVDVVGVIPNVVRHYIFDYLYIIYRKSVDPEVQDLVDALKDRQIIP